MVDLNRIKVFLIEKKRTSVSLPDLFYTEQNNGYFMMFMRDN